MAQSKRTLVWSLAFVAALGGLLFGYDTAVISGALGAIDHNFVDPRGLTQTAASSLSGWTVSCALVGCILGALVAGAGAKRYGRKAAMLFSGVLFAVGSVGSAYPELGFAPIGGMGVDALLPFMAYRIIGGIGVGMVSMVSPLYIAEISPPALRGRTVSLQQVAIVIGINLAQFGNWVIAARGNEAWTLTVGWRYMLLSEVIPAALFVVLLLFVVPDTPRWLVQQGRQAQALGVLKRLFSDDDARQTLAEISDSLVEKTRPLGHYGWGVIFVGLALAAFQLLVGINAVLYYAPQMFKNMGSSNDTALLQTVVVGVTNVAFTFVAFATIDKLGRKPLLIIGSVVMTVTMTALGCMFNAHALGVWALIAVLVYIAGFAMSWGPVVWVLLAEIFPNSIKSKAMAIGIGVEWLSNLLVAWSFDVMDGSSYLNAAFNHAFAYWLYGAMSLLSGLFVLKFVPETKGRRLEHIETLWLRKDAAVA
jgi:SP family xylose:H+ symportor-like MFS transporter